MELLGTCDERETEHLQEHALCDVLVKTDDYAYFVAGKGSVLSRFRIRLSVLNQHPSTLVALLAGADAVRVGGNITHILPESCVPRRCLRSALSSEPQSPGSHCWQWRTGQARPLLRPNRR